MRLPLKYSLNWDEFWECEYDILQFVVLTSPVVNSTLKCSQNLDKFCLKEKIYLEFTITPSDIASMASTGPQNRSGFCEGVQSKIDILESINLVLHDTCGILLLGVDIVRLCTMDMPSEKIGPQSPSEMG
jgi:hypothetical protein